MNLMVTKAETKNWLTEEPNVAAHLLQGYKETISDMTDDLLTDPRSSQNDHLTNQFFSSDPQYFMAFNPEPEKCLLTISSLYVFPHMRCRGIATTLINYAKLWVQDRGVIQVAIEKHKVGQLNNFYSNLGFQTTGVIHFNAIGVGYVDYFWSGKNIKLDDSPAGTIVTPMS